MANFRFPQARTAIAQEIHDVFAGDRLDRIAALSLAELYQSVQLAALARRNNVSVDALTMTHTE